MEQSSDKTLFITRHFVTTCCHPYHCCFNDRHQPVNNGTKHIRIVLGKMARTTLLVLLLYGGAVVVRKVISEHMRLGVDDAPEMRGVSTHEVLGLEGGRFQRVYKPESMHLHDALPTSDAIILSKDNSHDKGGENSD